MPTARRLTGDLARLIFGRARESEHRSTQLNPWCQARFGPLRAIPHARGFAIPVTIRRSEDRHRKDVSFDSGRFASPTERKANSYCRLFRCLELFRELNRPKGKCRVRVPARIVSSKTVPVSVRQIVARAS